MRLKVALVGSFPEEVGLVTGGVAGVVQSLADGLHRVADLDLHILAPDFNQKDKDKIEERDGMTVHWLKVPYPPFLTNWSLFRWKIQKYLLDIRPDITHFQGVASWLIDYPNPSVLTIHGIFEKDLIYRKGHLSTLRRLVVALSERKGRECSKNTIIINPYVLKVIGEQIRGRRWSIENPVEPAFFKVERKQIEHRVFFAGRVSSRKNVDGLLRAFSRVRKVIPDATLHIAGASESVEYEKACRRFVTDENLSDCVKFLGNVNRTDLLKELREAACLALVSHQETAPLIVEEAMAAGVPVIASRICGLPYMIEEGKTGYLVDQENDGDIASCLSELLEDVKVNQAMSDCCRQAAHARFHADAVASKTLEVYREILENFA